MYRSTPAARLLPLALLAAVACSRSCTIVAELSSVRETIEHPDANDMVISAVPSSEFIARFAYVDVFHLGGKREEIHREHWAVPLLDPGSTIPEDRTIYAWVITNAPQEPGASTQPWLDRVAAFFDGTPKRKRVVARVIDDNNRRSSLWSPVHEAERAHNLKSHPHAPIFVVR